MVRARGNPAVAAGGGTAVTCGAAAGGTHHRVRLGGAGEDDLAGQVRVAEGPVQGAGRAVDVDRGEDRAGFGRAVGDGGDEGAADAVVLVAGVDVQFGDHEGVVQPVFVAEGAEVGLDDGGPPVGAVVGHAVDEADEAVVDRGAECSCPRVGHVAEDDVAAYGHLVGAQAEGDGLDG